MSLNKFDKKEYMKEYREKNREALDDYKKRWIEENKERYKEICRKNMQNYRETNEELWKDYQKTYWAEYRKDPKNNFCHSVRTALLHRQKGTKIESKKREKGLTNQHVVDIAVLYDFFIKKGFLKEPDYNLKMILIKICNNAENIRLLKREKNTRDYREPQKRILRVSTRLERDFPFFCSGLKAYLESIAILEKGVDSVESVDRIVGQTTNKELKND